MSGIYLSSRQTHPNVWAFDPSTDDVAFIPRARLRAVQGSPSPFLRLRDTLAFVSRWATVTVTDKSGRRHSVDVLAESTYDAAHLFVLAAKQQPEAGIPDPTLETVFEVVTEGKVYSVRGSALQGWIERRRQELRGPKGALFKQRPTLP